MNHRRRSVRALCRLGGTGIKMTDRFSKAPLICWKHDTKGRSEETTTLHYHRFSLPNHIRHAIEGSCCAKSTIDDRRSSNQFLEGGDTSMDCRNKFFHLPHLPPGPLTVVYHFYIARARMMFSAITCEIKVHSNQHCYMFN